MANAPRGLHGQLTQDVGLLIATGEFEPGTQLVPEDLGERFGVSRTVVREALRVLESKGMIVARPKTGTRVLPVDSWDLLDREVIRWRVRGADRDRQLAELMEMRAAVEPMAARACATRAEPGLADKLIACCDAMEGAVESRDHAAFTTADITYHAALLTGSGNRIFAQVSGAIEAVLVAREELELLPSRIEHTAVAGHRAVAEAIGAADPERAVAAVDELITSASEELFKFAADTPARR